MRVVIALGGNALLRRGEPLELATQRANIATAARVIAAIAREHAVIVAHGNGPQVGLLALQAEAYGEVAPYPLDVLGAESEGMIGYLLEQSLRSELPEREIATLLTQVEVDAKDPAFDAPTKPIGPVYTDAVASELRRKRGWTLVRDGEGWRRAVPSPLPERIVEQATVRRLFEAGVLLICAGGGGIPVVRAPGGSLEGVDGVVDKDRTAALLCSEVSADRLLLLTDVACVYRDWPNAEEPIERATPEELEGRAFDKGSMGPKVAAACDFVRATGGEALIGALEDATAMIAGRAGTRVARADDHVR
jgi:carbamate kinase